MAAATSVTVRGGARHFAPRAARNWTITLELDTQGHATRRVVRPPPQLKWHRKRNKSRVLGSHLPPVKGVPTMLYQGPGQLQVRRCCCVKRPASMNLMTRVCMP